MTTYNVDEIFEDIPGDNSNVLMKIPDEICQELGWKPGDNISIKMENEGLVIRKNE